MFLVSGMLEKVLLLASICTFLSIESTNDLFQYSFREFEIIFQKTRIEKSLKNISSVSDWYDWLSNEFADLVLSTDVNSAESNQKNLFGAPRLFNIYLDYPAECLVFDRSNVNDYPQYCFPYKSINVINLLADTIPLPSSTTLCIQATCSEFKINNQQKLSILSRFISDELSLNAFTVEIPSFTRSQFKQIISTQLSLNGWISPTSSRVYGVDFTLVYPNEQRAMIFQVIVENWLGKMSASVLTTTVGSFISSTIFLKIMLSFYLTTACMSQLKLIIECNYIYKQRYVLVQISIIAELFYVLLYFLEQSSFSSIFQSNGVFEGSADQSTTFVETKGYIQITNYRILFTILNFIFLPFKIFNLLSWIRSYPFFIKFSNVLFRTWHGVARVGCLLLIIYLNWFIGIFIGLKRDNGSFDNLVKAMVSFFTFDPESQTFQEKQNYSMSLQSFYFIYTSTLLAMRGVILIVLLAVVVSGLRLSQDFEFDSRSPYQKHCVESVSDVCKKLDKFEKQTLSFIKGRQNLVNDRIIIWLIAGTDTFINERQMYFTQKVKNSILKRDIKLIEFSTIQEVHEFLQYLFKLKPNLLCQSQHYFRIILDFAFPKPNKDLKNEMFPRNSITPQVLTNADIQDHISKQIILLETFLELLNERGSTVPVMFNCRTFMSVTDKAKLIKIYNHLQFTFDFYELKDFATLMPLDQKQLAAHLDRQMQQKIENEKNHQKQAHLRDKKSESTQQQERDDEQEDLTESDNFEEQYNEQESELYDINADEEDTFNEDNTIINGHNNQAAGQNSRRYSFVY